MRVPRLFVCAVVALALVFAASPAVAAEEPLVGAEVVPARATATETSVILTDDTVYAIVQQQGGRGDQLSEIYARPLRREGDVTTVGGRSVVARAWGTTIVEHDGTLGYLRASDGRFALQGAAGVETMPVWRDEILEIQGPAQMDENWIVTGWGLVNRASGAYVGLDDLARTALPPGWWPESVRSIHVSGDQVAWAQRGVMRNPRDPNMRDLRATHLLVAPISHTSVGPARLLTPAPPYPSEPGIGFVRFTDRHLVWTDLRASTDDAASSYLNVLDRGSFVPVERPYFVGRAVRNAPETSSFRVRATKDRLVFGMERAVQGVPLPTTIVEDDPLVPGLDGDPVVIEPGAALQAAHGSLVAYTDTSGAVKLVDVHGGDVVVTEPPSPKGPVVVQTPRRLVDDRDVAPEQPRCVRVTGAAAGAGVPEGATGAVVNVTSVAPDGVGHVVLYPDTDANGATPLPPSGSTVNFEVGRDVANGTFVALPPGGGVCYGTRGARRAGVVVDVAGYTLAGAGVEMRAPDRILDTRAGGGPLAARTVRTVDVATAARLPESATSVLVNVTVTGATAPGNLRVFPAGGPVPATSTLNYAPGVDKANGTVVPLSAAGEIAMYSDTGAASGVHVVVDVVGHVEGGSVVGTQPQRLVDTREGSGVGELRGRVMPHTVVSAEVAGRGGVPEDAAAVVLNVTASNPTAVGNLRVYPDTAGSRRTVPPDASAINYIPGRDIPNMVVVSLPENGYVDFWSDQAGGSVDLIVDVVGYVPG